MRRILSVAVLLVGVVAGAFAYRVQAQKERTIARNMTLADAAQPAQPQQAWPPTVPSPGTILIADADAQSPAAAPAAAAPVPTQPPGPVHIVTFVDITPNNKDAGWAFCKQYAADTRKDPGVTSVQLLAQTNRPNHLVIYEVWQNEAAYEKHTTLAHTKDFHAKMVPIIGSPFDERPHYIVP